MATAFAPIGEDSGIRNEDRDPILAQAPHRIGKVALVVRDLDRVEGFYRDVIGLDLVGKEGRALFLGTGQSPLIELRHDPDAEMPGRRTAGLFHTAFLLPRRADLGAWLNFAFEKGIRLSGASDHIVSEALYLSDPEGNGIEIYVDRPSAEWRSPDGKVQMATDPIDLGRLMAAGRDAPWTGFPDQGVVGHVHLQVGNLEAADAFYSGLLGFGISARYPGASFYGSGGYHHQLASNIWNSRGAASRRPGEAGLAEVELIVDEDVLKTVRNRLADSPPALHSSAARVRDPWGNLINLRSGGPDRKGR